MPQILKGILSSELDGGQGRPRQAKATGCGDLKRDKIWAQMRLGAFDCQCFDSFMFVKECS